MASAPAHTPAAPVTRAPASPRRPRGAAHTARRLAPLAPTRFATTAFAFALALPALAAAQDDRREPNAFVWEGRIPDGRTLHLRSVNGDVRVERATGDRVTVTAEKRWARGGDPATVEVVAERALDGESMVVCALWLDGGRCDEADYRGGPRLGWGNAAGSTSVHFVVRVPDGVKIDVRTTNGGIAVEGVGSSVVARTTNGSVRAVSTGGPVEARTTNGSITAAMRVLDQSRDLDFRTVNGSVTVTLPADADADVELSTVNGSVSTEFPVTVSGRIDRRRLRARIGEGGAHVAVSTVNGSVTLRRGDAR